MLTIAYIHNDQRLQTGAHYINDLISTKLRERGVEVKNFYPSVPLIEAPAELKGLSNILFFYSLLEQREEILKCDLIQGTTYTPLPFLAFPIPVISHFGSTTKGFLEAVPRTSKLPDDQKAVFQRFRKRGILKETDFKSVRPLEDIAEIEKYVAQRADMVIATSKVVQTDLEAMGVQAGRIELVHNAIEDFWYEKKLSKSLAKPGLVFLGRLGNDAFTFKLKGLSRLITIYRAFPKLPKTTIAISVNEKLSRWMDKEIPNHEAMFNLPKQIICDVLTERHGQIFLNTSRYEGFSLSLVEAMSQGLVPISFPVGVAPEIIKNGENGYLINEPKEAIPLIKKINKDEALRARLAAAARKTSLHFQAEKMADQFIKLYKDMLAKPRTSPIPPRKF